MNERNNTSNLAENAVQGTDNQHVTHKSMGNLLADLSILVNTNTKLSVKKQVKGVWEVINLSNYRNSDDLVLVNTKNLAFTVTRWCPIWTIEEQITNTLSI